MHHKFRSNIIIISNYDECMYSNNLIYLLYIYICKHKYLYISFISLRIGIAGPPGAGKSTFIESIGSKLIKCNHKLAVLAIGIYIYIYMYIYIYIYMYICMCIIIYIIYKQYIYIYMYICMCIIIHIIYNMFILQYLYMLLNACMHVFIHAYLDNL